jgi:hypothetical protein
VREEKGNSVDYIYVQLATSSSRGRWGPISNGRRLEILRSYGVRSIVRVVRDLIPAIAAWLFQVAHTVRASVANEPRILDDPLALAGICFSLMPSTPLDSPQLFALGDIGVVSKTWK